MKDELDYVIYSEFKDSDWYIYWDKSYAHIKNHQLLVVWHAKADKCINFDYISLKGFLDKNTVKETLPFAHLLKQDDMRGLLSILHEWIGDIDYNFGKED